MTALPPPRGRGLAHLLLPGERGEVVLGDIEESYYRELEAGGSVHAARLRFLAETIRSAFALARSREQEAPAERPNRKGDRVMSPWLSDLGFSFKSLWRRPGLSLPAVLTLALGMGVSCAIFSVVEAVLIRTPAFEEPDRLVIVSNRQIERSEGSHLLSGADFADLRSRSRTLTDIAALDEVIVAPVVGTEQPSFARLGQMSANLFDILGIEPQLGRLLNEGDQLPLDGQPANPPPRPALLSYDYWVREYKADPDVIGRTFRAFSWEAEIVGVLPEDFTLVLPASAQVGEDLGAGIDVWSSYRTDYTKWNREARRLRLIGRMAEGETISDVRGELSSLASELRNEHAIHEEHGFDLGADVLLEARSAHLRPLLLLLSAAVLCVLLVACVNASGLLLTRAIGRSGELAIRAALGAKRGTLARLVLVESLLLALAGGFLGLLIAVGGMELLKWLSPAGLPQADGLHLNRSVVLFAMAIVPVSGLVAGLLPSLRAAGIGRDHLSLRSGTPSPGHRRVSEAMVSVQVALTVVLLVGTGLMLRSFYELQKVPLGFEPSGVLTVDFSTVGQPPDRASDTGFADWIEQRRNQERALSEALGDLPGVEAAGAVFPVPLNGVYARTCAYTLEAEGDPERQGVAYFRNIWPGYFESLGIPLLRGRDFTYDDDQRGLGEWGPMVEQERTDTPRVIVDSRLAARLWPGEEAVGRRLTFAVYADIPQHAEVVGVVPFVPQGEIEDPMETIYIPRSYYRSQELTLTLRTADTTAQRRAITETVRSIFPDSPVDFEPLDAYVDRALAPTRFVLTLLVVFAGTALLLASVGLYGTMALMVRTRTNELGLHLALGAPPRVLGKRVVLRSVALASIGVVAGLCVALATTRWLASYLVEVSPTDPRTFALAALVQVAVAALAAWVPARRAAAIDPVTALRVE